MQNLAKEFSVNEIDKLSEAIHESGQSLDSQETISENNLFPEINEDETRKNLRIPFNELQTSAGFSGNSDFLDKKCYLESSESDCYSSDSNDINSPTGYDNYPQMEKKRKNVRSVFSFRQFR